MPLKQSCHYSLCVIQTDVHVVPQVKAIHNEKPTLFFYDKYPGGVGLSEKVYDEIDQLIREAISMIERCPCETGCPSCVGTDLSSETAKGDVLKLFQTWL